MKLRAIHLKDHPKLGNLSVEFHQNGKIDEAVFLFGGCCAGKTLLLDLATACWAASTERGWQCYVLRDCRARIDFEVGGELAMCQIEGDKITGSPLLKSKIDFEGRSGLLLRYGRVDPSEFGFGRSGGETAGTQSMYFPIQDLIVNGGIKDGIVLIDDFDTGLDYADQKAYWAYLWKHYRSLGCQMIVTGRRGLGVCREIGLLHRENPIDLVLEDIKEWQSRQH